MVVQREKFIICVYCGDKMNDRTDERNMVADRNILEHLKVHKVLRHKKIPIKVYGQLFSAVKSCKTTLTVLNNL